MSKFVITLKKRGTLVAFDSVRSFWAYCGVLYTINVEGTQYSEFACFADMERHLLKLYNLYGRRYFTDDKDICIVNKDFLSQWNFA